MDTKHEVGDFVILKPYPPVVGKVIKVHENGMVTILWPSGTKSTFQAEKYKTVLSARNINYINELDV